MIAAVLALALQAAAPEVFPTQPVVPPAATASPTLVGQDGPAVRARLGEPDVARAEGSGAMWTYRRPSCSVFVFFQDRPGEGLKVSSLAAGPRAPDAPAPDLETCLASEPPAG